MIGRNYYNIDFKDTSRHAEVDAVMQLKHNHSKRFKKVTIIILRTNNKGDRCMLAKPCNHCIQSLRYMLERKRYKLHKGYYTNDAGDFTQFHL